jgi:hypothetical protein
MIDDKLAKRILTKVTAFWAEEIRKPYFASRVTGKEAGHDIAGLIEEKTTAEAITASDFVTRHQCDARGRALKRSMADIWVESNGIFHPVNVKTGVSDTNGQPNVVSLKKLLRTLLSQRIDSYYLLIVKLKIAEPIESQVFFVDLLDYLDYVTFDSGPGQIMLKARLFFDAMNAGARPARRTVGQKVHKLMELLEDGERRLAVNRRRVLTELRKKVQDYEKLGRYEVTPESQAALNLR